MVFQLVGCAHDGEEGHGAAGVVGAREDAAAARGVVPAGQLAVGDVGGDAEVGCVLVQGTDAGFVSVGEDEGAGGGAEAVGADEEVEVSLLRGGFGKGDFDPVVGVVDGCYIVVEDVLHLLLCTVVEKLCKCTPQDFGFSGKTLCLATLIDSEERFGAILGINEGPTFFVGCILTDSLFESHAPDDFQANTADVYILAYCPQYGSPLDYCHVSSGTGKPEGESWASYARPCYEDTKIGHS